jgi:N-acetylmuramic acid 6-phosphate etherase
MIDMQLSNKKLVKRGVGMIMNELNIDEKSANDLLSKHQSVRKAINDYNSFKK